MDRCIECEVQTVRQPNSLLCESCFNAKLKETIYKDYEEIKAKRN